MALCTTLLAFLPQTVLSMFLGRTFCLTNNPRLPKRVLLIKNGSWQKPYPSAKNSFGTLLVQGLLGTCWIYVRFSSNSRNCCKQLYVQALHSLTLTAQSNVFLNTVKVQSVNSLPPCRDKMNTSIYVNSIYSSSSFIQNIFFWWVHSHTPLYYSEEHFC